MGLTVTRGQPSFHHTAYTEDDITLAISVDGAVQGLILMGFNYRTAFRLLQAMLGEELNTNLPLSDFLRESELAQSALRELANILAGRAATLLETAGYSCVISLPELMMQRGVLLSVHDFWQLTIPLHSEVGDLILRLTLTPKEQLKGTGFLSYVARQIVQPKYSVVRCDFANPDNLGRAAYLLLQQVQERYQHLMRQQVSMRYRLPIHLSPPRLEKDTFAHFLQRDYQWSVVAAFAVAHPLGSSLWLLALSQSIALVLIDRWLGGPGKPPVTERQEWTPMELAAVRQVLANLGETYAEAWRPHSPNLALRLTHLFVGDISQHALALPNAGGALLISHRIQANEETGTLQWLVPTDSLSQLVATRGRRPSFPAFRASSLSPQLPVHLRCGWQGQPLSLWQLSKLQVGTVLLLTGPCQIWCEGHLLGIGRPFRRNGRIVVKILRWNTASTVFTDTTDGGNGQTDSGDGV